MNAVIVNARRLQAEIAAGLALVREKCPAATLKLVQERCRGIALQQNKDPAFLPGALAAITALTTSN
jgi:hypothetical protein